MKNVNKLQLSNYICAFMCLLVLITQFLPFWNCSDCREHEDVDKTVSIAEYVWFPDHHRPITKGMTDVYLEAYGEDYTDEDGKKYKFAVDDIVTPLVILLAGSIIGAVLGFVFSDKSTVALLSTIVGGVGLYWYLTCPAMKIGASWYLHLIVYALAAVAGIGALIYGFIIRIKK